VPAVDDEPMATMVIDAPPKVFARHAIIVSGADVALIMRLDGSLSVSDVIDLATDRYC